jgi:hypothetical protein
MMTSSEPRRLSTGREAADLQLEVLDRLPCGCIVAIQRVPASGVTVVSLEAKGPHCPFTPHRANKVIRLGVPDVADYDDEDGLAI